MGDIMRFKRGMVFWVDDRNDKEKNNNSVWVNGRECKSSVMKGTRPWVIVSCDEGNRTSSCLNMLPITSSKDPLEKSEWHVHFVTRGDNYTICVEQIKTIETFMLGNYIYTLDDRLMEKIEKAMMGQFVIRQKISCTEEVLEQVINLIQPTIKKVMIEKATVSSQVFSVRNIEDIALKIGQDIEDLFIGNYQVEEEVKKEDDRKVEFEIVEDQDVNLKDQEIEEDQDQGMDQGMDQVDNLIKNMENKVHIRPVKNENKSVKPKKSVEEKRDKKAKGRKWTMEEKVEFNDDCEKMIIPEIMRKWGIDNKGTYYSTKYVIKKELRMLEEVK